ncbi:PREDICTED: uncharacterized protein LOC104594431 [Nelumbo nucifera]|uniref:Transmembrane protein n=2 Tax=Nelumbo nucifera TaxID=4432 RepID=A0A822XPW5_NELNU|nr:PREDICTED: uncharacterized protein LOC104594431 [Nelumbo nucifera]DAD23644.1 TPA_asm: hypothetical protein HUJ06_025107 [Nelumbo nucifera]
MEQIKLQHLTTVRKLNKSLFSGMVLQFLLSLFIFSFLISYTSWLSFYLHSFNLFSFQHLFNYNVDRKYMFLLCNGILVFLATNSGLIGSSPLKTDIHDDFFKSEGDGDGLRSVPQVSEMEASVVDMEVGVENIGFSENIAVVVVEKEVIGNGFLNTEGVEEEREEENGLLSTEELNKKFDDFIKRMKEGLRNEAQQLMRD